MYWHGTRYKLATRQAYCRHSKATKQIQDPPMKSILPSRGLKLGSAAAAAFAGALLSFLALVPAASANTIYSLSVPNTAVSPYPAPYGTVTVDWLSLTSAKITFDALTTGGYTYRFGGAQSVDVNVSGAFSVGSLTGFAVHSGWPNVTSGNVSDFGDMNLTIDNFDGASHTFSQASFVLTALNGNTWSDSAHVLTADSKGFLAAAHFWVYDSAGGIVTTGYAGNGPPRVPEGGLTVAFVGLGLLGLFGLRRRLNRS